MPFNKMTPEEMKHKARPENLKPIWNLYKDGLTQGSIAAFLNCREQFRLIVKEGWSARGESTAIAFGSAFHHVLAEVHTGLAKDPKASLVRYRKKLVKEGAKYTTTEKENLELLLAQVRVVAEAYLVYWAKHDEKKKWVAREVAFTHPHQRTDGTVVKQIPFRGRWDGLYEGPKGNLWLHETKTKATIDEDGIRLSLPFDLQTMLYGYVAEKVYNRKVGGTMYDVIRRPQLKQGKDILPIFLERIKKDIGDRPTHYFYRWEVSLAKNDIANWVKQQLQPIIDQIVAWDADPNQFHYMRPGALTTAWGSRCDLFYAITTGNFYGLYRRKHVYPELID